MLADLDTVLRHLFLSQVPTLTTEDQIRFQPPDQDWRNALANLGSRMALNVYLLDLRENRRLRSNERVRSVETGVAVDAPAPARIDCHYLITAWSPAQQTTDPEPTVAEHGLLY